MSSEEPGAAPDQVWQQPLNLTDPKAMRALAHPVRMALLELLSVTGTITATQASEALGESPANCAFHLRTLGKYGFVREAGGGRGRERPWTATRRTLRISSVEQTDAQAALAADALSVAWFEHWVERVRRTYPSNARMPGWEHASNMSNRAVFLTAEETEQVNREMLGIIDRYQDRQRDPSSRPVGALPVEVAVYTSPLTDFAPSTPTAEESQDIS
jgi:DNA-binding transcriptional ArsR family regulator